MTFFPVFISLFPHSVYLSLQMCIRDRMETRDVVIVGGGPAGLAAAVELYKKGIRNVLIVEREKTMGGILRQCIHDGFGLTRFGETLSGPEYAQKFIDEVMELKIPYVTDTTVLSVSPDKVVTLASSNGLKKIQAKAVTVSYTHLDVYKRQTLANTTGSKISHRYELC